MKKIILTSFFLLSIFSFSRYKSLSSGKIFHFGPVPPFMGNGLFRGTKGIVKITFNGNGYKNLEYIDWDYVE